MLGVVDSPLLYFSSSFFFLRLFFFIYFFSFSFFHSQSPLSAVAWLNAQASCTRPRRCNNSLCSCELLLLLSLHHREMFTLRWLPGLSARGFCPGVFPFPFSLTREKRQETIHELVNRSINYLPLDQRELYRSTLPLSALSSCQGMTYRAPTRASNCNHEACDCQFSNNKHHFVQFRVVYYFFYFFCFFTRNLLVCVQRHRRFLEFFDLWKLERFLEESWEILEKFLENISKLGILYYEFWLSKLTFNVWSR